MAADGAGQLADLDASLFSRATGRRGYWAPGEFYMRLGANVYFLTPYDPDKTPVLFVHGAAGSPQDWRYFFTNLDLRRYQPWFFYYPSGASVGWTSDLLAERLTEVQKKYHPKRLYIVAHSMGGLVVRSLLGKNVNGLPEVKLFVSISTPWGGEGLTNLAPPLVPSWRDLRPDGLFLKTLFQETLPPEIDYYLLFGYKGNRGLVRPNNDGTVTLESELRMSAQAEAKRVFGFDESHVSILSSKEVAATLNLLFLKTDHNHGN